MLIGDCLRIKFSSVEKLFEFMGCYITATTMKHQCNTGRVIEKVITLKCLSHEFN